MSDMDCDGLRKVLFDHVDGLLGGGEADAAREHLAACGPCRALQEEVRRNFSALDAWEEEELPAGAFARLQARIPAGPTPVHEIGTAPAGTRRRGWLRVAVPYGAGIATAAAATWLLVLPLVAGNGAGAPPTLRIPAVSPSAVSPARGPVAASVAGGADAGPDSRPDPRKGERKLEFRDVDFGVRRTFQVPSDVDPASLILLRDAPRWIPDDKGVR